MENLEMINKQTKTYKMAIFGKPKILYPCKDLCFNYIPNTHSVSLVKTSQRKNIKKQRCYTKNVFLADCPS